MTPLACHSEGESGCPTQSYPNLVRDTETFAPAIQIAMQDCCKETSCTKRSFVVVMQVYGALDHGC